MFSSLFKKNSTKYEATYKSASPNKLRGRFSDITGIQKPATEYLNETIELVTNNKKEYITIIKVANTFVEYTKTTELKININTVKMQTGEFNYCVFTVNDDYDKLFYSKTCDNVDEILKNYPGTNNCIVLNKYDEDNEEGAIYIDYVRNLEQCQFTKNALELMFSIIHDIAKRIDAKKLYLIDKATFTCNKYKLTAIPLRILLGKKINDVSIYQKHGFKPFIDLSNQFNDISNIINEMNLHSIINEIKDLCNEDDYGKNNICDVIFEKYSYDQYSDNKIKINDGMGNTITHLGLIESFITKVKSEDLMEIYTELVKENPNIPGQNIPSLYNNTSPLICSFMNKLHNILIDGTNYYIQRSDNVIMGYNIFMIKKYMYFASVAFSKMVKKFELNIVKY